ncbi:MAG: sigma-54 interaction domain-containing protein [Caldimicrobium sp.]|jgi:two-component system response regulator HydG/two-component system response regulator AtoC
MRIFLFTLKEVCQVYFWLKDYLKEEKAEIYFYESEENENFSKLLNSSTDLTLLIFDFESFQYTIFDLIQKFKKLAPTAYIIVVNAPEDVELAVKFLEEGVYHYFTKELDKKCLYKLLNKITNIQKRDLEKEPLNIYVGRSKAIQKIKEILPIIAETHCNVLIVGETGTGKELLARIIHQLSPRSKAPFVILDCTTLQETIFESEVFGYEKGAFTGAYASKKGLVELADGGTLFIDEIGELPLPLQKKFLRFIQEKTFMRVGGTRFYKADVRIIAATNRNLEEEVKKGNFRSDLYFRLNTLIIEIPPLRERKEDIPLLIEHFIKIKSSELGRTFKGFSKGFLETLMNYDWPGNVRELINIIERALILSPDGYLSEDILPTYLSKKEDLSRKESSEKDFIDHRKRLNLKEIEKELVLKALELNNWNQTKTAEYLGISRKQLINKMKKYGLSKEKYKNWLKSG